MSHTQKAAQASRKAKLLKDELANISKRDSNLLCVSLFLDRENVMPQVRKKNPTLKHVQIMSFPSLPFPSSLEDLK